MAQSIEELESLLEAYDSVFAVMDRAVAMECPASVRLAEILNTRSVPGMLVEAHESTKTIGKPQDHGHGDGDMFMAAGTGG